METTNHHPKLLALLQDIRDSSVGQLLNATDADPRAVAELLVDLTVFFANHQAQPATQHTTLALYYGVLLAELDERRTPAPDHTTWQASLEDRLLIFAETVRVVYAERKTYTEAHPDSDPTSLGTEPHEVM